MDVSLIWLAFVLGLSSTVHCWGMCGGLLIAFSSPGPGTTLMRALAFNLGRTSSYILAGAMVGMLGGVAVSGGSPGMAHAWLQAGASMVMIASGLGLLGWLPGGRALHSLGLALWRRLQPLSAGILPAVHFHQRFLLGMIWGWLPCGLVYSTLAIAAAQGSGLRGAAMLAAFGAGTLPGMVAAQFGVQRLRHTLQRLRLQFLAACLLLASGVVLLLMQGPWAASHGPLHDHGRGGTHPTHVHPSSPER